MLDLPGVVFVGAACFLLGMVLVDVFWDTRAMEEPFTEESGAAVIAFYTNNVVGMRRRAPYLIALFPTAFVVVISALVYKYLHASGAGDHHGVVTSATSMVILFPLIILAAASTFPTIGTLITKGPSLPLAEQRRLQRRLFYQHVAYLILTFAAVVAHIAL